VFLVVVGILDLLGAVRKVPEDADAVLDALVVNVGLFDALLDDVHHAVHEAVALAQLPAAVVAGRTYVPENCEKNILHTFVIIEYNLVQWFVAQRDGISAVLGSFPLFMAGLGVTSVFYG
jgi:hypothetical protein